ncbi:MAG: undecaprenyl diphosphate synthase family protein [Bacteroidota bacterium]
MSTTSDFHPTPGSVPFHVGIIPDGGRRWALANGCTLENAYKHTRSLLEAFTSLLLENGVQMISIYLNSIQNFRRNPEVLSVNLGQIESGLKNEIKEIAERNNLRIVIAGNRKIIPESLLAAISKIEQSSLKNSNGQVNLLLAYDPLEEIIQACNASDNPNQFYKYLWVNTPVDLVIRTGKAPLLSNFLPLQSAYARLFFLDKLFNDLTTSDLKNVLNDFAKIERKFGE